jgi:hypothetical protein
MAGFTLVNGGFFAASIAQSTRAVTHPAKQADMQNHSAHCGGQHTACLDAGMRPCVGSPIDGEGCRC